MGQQNILVIHGNVPSEFRVRSKVAGHKKLKWTVKNVAGPVKVDGMEIDG